ncbi:DUF2182 domain-containing protein [Vibrio splendidus]|uniref:copper chaperone n=1 Tax=Vibrio splendidus TaxID=29497 RepID=UPI0003622E32|nr:DUF2182 domain-containing protein [Vibrio splendidus]OED78190.1 hypothetical protein A144_22625 [Vibrio splendidus ZF-90]OEF21504.1 hypothetical protein A145_07300 [Vibrio splendidus 5S-101]PTO54481.1 hypothetical protein CWN94_09830 [Vibrio splendidus]PTP37180.1 hypothetical protein CWN95_02840 [Vibrio splendidus]PTP76241.1 hypothetical protein CWO00_11780 [Vibrio splendidus]
MNLTTKRARYQQQTQDVLRVLGIDVAYIRKFRFSAGVFVALFALAWIALIVPMSSGDPHSAHHPVSGINSDPWLLTLMVIGMMLPMISVHLLHIANSLNPRHRLSAMSLFTATYTICWLLLLMGVAIGVEFPVHLFSISHEIYNGLAVTFLLLAWWWGQNPINKSIKNRCGGLGVVQASGFRLYRSIVSYAMVTWVQCCVECGLVMIAMMFMSKHSVVLMLLMTIALLVERYLVTNKFRSVSAIWGLLAVWTLI